MSVLPSADAEDFENADAKGTAMVHRRDRCTVVAHGCLAVAARAVKSEASLRTTALFVTLRSAMTPSRVLMWR